MTPEIIKMTTGEGGNPLFDGCRLFLKFSFSWRKKKEQLVDGEGLGPFVDVGRFADDVKPDGVFRGRELTPRLLRAVAKGSDATGEDVVEREWERRPRSGD